MKILHFISSVDPATGGPIEALRQLCLIYCEGGHEIEIASLDSPEFVQTIEFPARIVALGPGRGTYAYTSQAIPWLRKNLPRYDLVFVDGVWNFNTWAAYRALSGTAIPWAIFTHGMLDPYFKRQFPLKHIKKSLYWHLLLNKAFRSANAVLFTCEEEKLLARQSFARYKAHEIVVPFGIFPPDTGTSTAETFLARWPELRGKRLALSLGRIHPKKGADILIESFAATLSKDPAWHLVLAGPDQIGWQKDLEALAQRLDIAHRITWTGSVAGELKWGAFTASEIFVLPSHQENFGIVVAEALACGLPVILSDKVNIWREVIASSAGLVDQDTIEGTSRSLATWSQLSHQQRAIFRNNATQCFHDKFNYKQTSKIVLENLDRLVRSTPRYKSSDALNTTST